MRRARRQGERGQSLVEFAVLLVPFMLIFLGIVQFGFIFNAYVTVANATREGAREGSIYVSDQTATQSSNDSARAARINQAIDDTMGLLTGSPTVAISYTNPWGEPATVSRKGWHVTVRVTYPLALVNIPLINNLLPVDGSGNMPIVGEATMVIN